MVCSGRDFGCLVFDRHRHDGPLHCLANAHPWAVLALALASVVAVLGLGIAALPDFVVQDDPNIERVLPDLEGPEVESFFVYAEELRHSKRIAVLRDYLIKKVSQSAF